MEERLRFTGESPPPSLWHRFPNWQNAYEEEGLPGQDESTLRPADNQQTIDDDVSITAGDAVFASGQSAPALLGVLCGELEQVYVYPEPEQDKCWVLGFDMPSRTWVAMNEDRVLQVRGILPVPVEDPEVFPLRIIITTARRQRELLRPSADRSAARSRIRPAGGQQL